MTLVDALIAKEEEILASFYELKDTVLNLKESPALAEIVSIEEWTERLVIYEIQIARSKARIQRLSTEGLF